MTCEKKIRSGVTLIEVMITLAIVTIGIFSLMQSFSFIQKAVQMSKNKTLASNLAQEKMQILKQKSYYQVAVTSVLGHDNTSFAPESLDYDTGYFPPEEITEGGVTFTRYTYVQAVKEDSGALGPLAPNMPDTGMKRITITVVWGYGSGKRKVTLRSIYANSDTVMAFSVFKGTVKSTMSAVLGGAVVSLVEAAGYSDTTDSSGQYGINCTPQNYTLMASATGYYTQVRKVLILAGVTQVNDFTMVKKAAGKITGDVWLDDHLVISQVVGSTVIVYGSDQEYVEVFNPTSSDLPMAGTVGIKFQRAADASQKTVSIDYLTPSVPAHSYYLFANTGTIMVNGESVYADAVWSATNSVTDFPYFSAEDNIIPVDENGSNEGGGAVELYRTADGSSIDKVGWNKSSFPAPFYEGAAIVQTIGLSRGELYARFASTSGVDWNYGPAYDSNNNSVDFYDYTTAVISAPHNAYSGVKNVISGTPAVGAVVTCGDGYSASAEAYSVGSPPNAHFSLVDVATGSWTVLISSWVYGLEQDTVTIPSSGFIYNFPSSSTLLTQQMDSGYVTGKVLSVAGAPLNGLRVTSGGANFTTTDLNGSYRLRVIGGMVDITANPVVGGIANYVTASSVSIPVAIGEVHSGVDFVLYTGGRVRGFVTRGGDYDGIAGVAVTVMDVNGLARDQQVTDTNGRFTSVVLSTGQYVVGPVLNTLETSSPVSSTVTLTTGGTLFASTFTMTGALGTVTGSVKFAGKPIKTGVLVVVTTQTLTGSPPVLPDISSNTVTPYYMTSSQENGSFSVDVRGNAAAYHVYAYYAVPDSTGSVIYSSSISTLTVVSGMTTSGVNFSW